MSRDTVLARGRAMAEAGFSDACTITRDGPMVTDYETGAVTSTPTTIYTGRCRLQLRVGSGGRRTDDGEATTVVLTPELQLPMVGTEAVRHGDRVLITAARDDAALVGRIFVVRDEAPKSQATARRLNVEEAT